MSAEEVKQLPAYSVAPEFTLLYSPRCREGDNVVKFVSVDDRLEHRRFDTFRSGSLKSGDEIVSINGKSAAQMLPHECRITLSKLEIGKRIELEVRAPGSRTVRNAVAFRVGRKQESAAPAK